MNGEPLMVFQTMLEPVMSPVPSGRMANVGPARPERHFAPSAPLSS